MIDYLVPLLIVVAVMIAIRKRSICGMVFMFPMAFHYLVSGDDGGLIYFVSSGFVSAITVMILLGLDKGESITYSALSTSCIFADMIGCALWFNSLSQTPYVGMYAIIYLLTILTLGRENDRRTPKVRGGHGGSWVFGHIMYQRNSRSNQRKAT